MVLNSFFAYNKNSIYLFKDIPLINIEVITYTYMTKNINILELSSGKDNAIDTPPLKPAHVIT
ncbi:hypothetical protein EXW69_02720 [Francisella tularensis subsp. mediasiatica]|nr:hypothetical protein [Francisella tularensis]RZP34363.1 hypothetical protein EXW67_03060 [Francisella tularensis subsp. mediasiatica]RZP38271.1 hypothetical protein EXW69_02720 [Francisella tularensis subsp. mediasiatica]RZP42941.1 hypothetical protein EXW68_02635 [Francisella tularensis subsp. mediasiatica]